MTLTRKEKKLAAILLLIAALMLVGEGFPRLWQFWSAQWREIETARRRIEQYRKLPESAPYWRDKHRETTAAVNRLQTGLLAGGTPNLVGAKLQGELKRIAGEEINISSMSLPEIARTGNWMLVSQTITLQASPRDFWDFLQRLGKGPHYLPVMESSLRLMGGRLHGTLKITGFSRQQETGGTAPDKPQGRTPWQRN